MDKVVPLEAARLRRLRAEAPVRPAFALHQELLEALAINQRWAKIIFFYTKPLAAKSRLSKLC